MLIRVLGTLSLFSFLLAAQDPAAVARKALDAMLAGQYDQFLQLATPDVQKSLPAAELAKLGATLKTYGAMEQIGDPQVTKSGPNTIVVFPARFATQNINFRMIVNSSGLVNGFFQLPGGVNWQRPAYSKPDTFKERNVTVGEGDWKLSGTLTVPNGAGPFPAVVLVHGSGPNDRDETVGGNKVFKDLAEGLASQGVVVLRYEKRTLQYRVKMTALARYTVDDEVVDDAVAAVALLRSQPEVNGAKIYILGHSLGGYMAPRIAAETKVAGIILMGAGARHLEDLLVEQVTAMGVTGQQLETAKAIQARVKKLEAADEDAPAVGGLPASYWLDLKEYDPIAEAKNLGIPILILQGERDQQVPPANFALWKTGLGSAKGVVSKSYPALNHIFETNTGKTMQEEYAKPGHVAPEVIADIAQFVK